MRSRSTTSSTVSRSALRLIHPIAREAPQHLERRVGPDAEDREDRLPAAVAAQEHDAGPQRARRRGRRRPCAPSHVDGAVGPLDARERVQERELAVALGARRCRGSRPAHLRGRSGRSGRPAGRRCPGRVLRVDGATRSGNAAPSGRPIMSATRRVLGHVDGVERALADAVAQDRDAIDDAQHLGQAVADVDDADAAARPRSSTSACSRSTSSRPQRRRRLVQTSTFGSDCRRLDDLEHLPLGQRQAAHRAPTRRPAGRTAPTTRRRPPLHRAVGRPRRARRAT